MGERVLVVKREVILKNYFQGFVNSDYFDYLSIILKNGFFKERFLAEHNPELKQPIPYAVLIDESNKIFVYLRSKSNNYKEDRLKGLWSIGIGGHVNENDKGINPIESALMRELNEEITLNGEINDFKLIGYINDDSNDVGKVHFGIVYLIKAKIESISIKDKEIHEFRFEDISKLNAYDLENWSKIILKSHFY